MLNWETGDPDSGGIPDISTDVHFSKLSPRVLQTLSSLFLFLPAAPLADELRSQIGLSPTLQVAIAASYWGVQIYRSGYQHSAAFLKVNSG